MHFGRLVLRNTVRSPLRTLMTIVSLALMVTAFIFPRALVDGQRRYQEQAADDRIIVMPKRGGSDTLPLRYAEELRNTPGVQAAFGLRWAGLKLPGKDDVLFSSNAVEVQPFMAIHDEIVAPELEKQAFLEDERSALVSVDLAREQGWKVGDRVVFETGEPKIQVPLAIASIYVAERAEWARRSVWMHYVALNRGLPAKERDRFVFLVGKVADPSQGGHIARAIDRHYDAAPVRTLSMEDQALTAANMGRLSAVFLGLELVSYLMLAVTLSILINTLSLSVRERRHELGVLRAIGFGPPHLYLLVLGEACVLGLCGAALGLGLAYPLLEGVVARVLKERLQWSEFNVPSESALAAAAAMVGLSLLSALWPAAALSRIEVRKALGRTS